MGVIAAEWRRFGGWAFEIGEESGSATPGEVGVWLVKALAGAGLATRYLRSFFFEPAAWQHAEHSCRKVARDECYRGALVKEAVAFQKRGPHFRALAGMDGHLRGFRSPGCRGGGSWHHRSARPGEPRRDAAGRRSARNRAEKALRCAERDVGPAALSRPDAKKVSE
jgi:hypothetical protein